MIMKTVKLHEISENQLSYSFHCSCINFFLKQLEKLSDEDQANNPDNIYLRYSLARKYGRADCNAWVFGTSSLMQNQHHLTCVQVQLAWSNKKKITKAKLKAKQTGRTFSGQDEEFYNLDINIIFDNVFEGSIKGKSLNMYVSDFFDVLWAEVGKVDRESGRGC